jgi:flavodoxin
MKIGIIVYSQTGHTLSVAVALQEKLTAGGHVVNLERVEASGPVKPGATDVQLKTRPKVGAYDALVFASPVWGGAMAPPMTSYLEQVTSLQGKRVVCLVTHLFPNGLGANQTFNQMREVCVSKGAVVCGWGGVGWPRFGQKRRIAAVIDDLAGCFKV